MDASGRKWKKPKAGIDSRSLAFIRGSKSDQRLGLSRLRGFLGFGIGLKLVAELRDEALGRPRARLAEGADRAAGNLIGDALEQRGVFGAGLTMHHARG